MKEITSKRTGKKQVISDETWNDVVKRGWAGRFEVRVLEEKKLKPPVIAPPEVKTKTVKRNG